MPKRQITPTARAQLAWIQNSYGIGEKLDRWCRGIVAKADRRTRPATEIGLKDILDELAALSDLSTSDFALSARRFRDGGWMQRLRDIQALILKRTPPHKLRRNSKIFRGLSGGLQVEVQAIYEIDLGASAVIFYHFESYTPAVAETTNSPDTTEW